MRLIDADAVIEESRELYCKDCHMRKDSTGKIVYDIGEAPCRGCDLDLMLCNIDNAQTIEQKSGKWSIDGVCSECGGHAPYWLMTTTSYLSDFCPHCGAKMQLYDIADDMQTLLRLHTETNVFVANYSDITSLLHY